MRGTVLYGPRDVRFEDREAPRIEKPTDAILRIAVTCVCGSDLWPYRGIQKVAQPTPMGHEYCKHNDGTEPESGLSRRCANFDLFREHFGSHHTCPTIDIVVRHQSDGVRTNRACQHSSRF